MKTVIVSDIHLDSARPDITAAFFNFIRTKASDAEALYILGDLFEVWLGDDEPPEVAEEATTELKALKEKGVKLYYQHGNRDFLIGKQFADQVGMEILPEYHLVDLYGQNVLLCHGDTLCTDDHSYMRYRNVVRASLVKTAFTKLPIKARNKIASKVQKESGTAKDYKPEKIMDVNQHEVQKVMNRADVQTMIHGHTHRPAVHTFECIDSHSRLSKMKRMVLGDWGNLAWWIEADSSGLQLLSEPI